MPYYQYGAEWVYHRVRRHGPDTVAQLAIPAELSRAELLKYVYEAQERGWVRLEQDPQAHNIFLRRVCLGAKAPE